MTRDHTDGLVIVELLDAVAHLQLNRPETANALSYELLEELAARIGETGRADGVRAMVLSGAGGRFSAGADLAELAADATDVDYDDAVAAAARAMAASPVPVIAAVERYAFGAGVDLAWSCDAVVVAADARLAVPATQLGLLYNPEPLATLHARIGDRAWRRLVLFGDEIDAETAYGLGMGESLARPGDAVNEAFRLATLVTTASADAVAATKGFSRAIIAGTDGDPGWQSLRRELLAGPDRRAALRDRRKDRLGP